MKEILDRLAKFEMFEIVVFPDEVILNHPVEEWPICDALISFFSKGKVIKSNTCRIFKITSILKLVISFNYYISSVKVHSF